MATLHDGEEQLGGVVLQRDGGGRAASDSKQALVFSFLFLLCVFEIMERLEIEVKTDLM